MLSIYFQRFSTNKYPKNNKTPTTFIRQCSKWFKSHKNNACENSKCAFHSQSHISCLIFLQCHHYICFSCFNDYSPLNSLTVACPICFTLSIVELVEFPCINCGLYLMSISREIHASNRIIPASTSKRFSKSMNGSEVVSSHVLAHSDSHKLEHLHPVLKAKWLDLQKTRDQCEGLSNSLEESFKQESENLEKSIDQLKQLLDKRKRVLLNHYAKLLAEKVEALKQKSIAINKAQLEMSNVSKNQTFDEKFSMDEMHFPNLTALTKSGIFKNEANFLHNESQHDKFSDIQSFLIESEINKLGCLEVAAKTLSIKLKETILEHEKYVVSCQNKKNQIHILFTDDTNKCELDVDVNSVKVQLTACFSDKICSVNFTKIQKPWFQLEYAFQQQGVYKLKIKVHDQDVKPILFKCIGESEYGQRCHALHTKTHDTNSLGSHASKSASVKSRPQSTTDERPLTAMTHDEDDLQLTIGQKGYGFGHFLNPQGVCYASNGRIIVADSTNQCIQVFNVDGECILKFGSKGRRSGEMLRPTDPSSIIPTTLIAGRSCLYIMYPSTFTLTSTTGVCTLHGQNLILVADYDNCWVNVYKSDGQYSGRFGASANLLGPKGIVADRDGHVIVADNKASSVHVYDAGSMKLVRRFGTRGDRNDQLAGPHYIAVDDKNRLFITDFHHHCVKAFDCSGTFISSFGSLGSGNGQFNAPTGIAIDDKTQNVLVADWGNNRVQVFDRNGSFLWRVGRNIYGPQGVCAMENRFAVCDSGNHCVKIYDYLTL